MKVCSNVYCYCMCVHVCERETEKEKSWNTAFHLKSQYLTRLCLFGLGVWTDWQSMGSVYLRLCL